MLWSTSSGVWFGRLRSALPGVLLLLGLALSPGSALAQSGDGCPRPAPGSVVTPPPDLYSSHGALNIKMDYFTALDAYNRTLFCFVTAKGAEGPTLHVKPGDTLHIMLTNKVPDAGGAAYAPSGALTAMCKSPVMTPASVNMHFHGTNTSPKCHSDEVIRTLINSGESFEYSVHIPADEPPGLYWYHPHVHGMSSPAVQGGATGVIEVEGIAAIQPIVAGLPERFLVVRDLSRQVANQSQGIGLTAPSWDLSLNYVPVPYPTYVPSVIEMNPGAQEFWRVANTAADTIVDLKLTYDGKAQPLTLVALDGVPIGSQNGKKQGYTITKDHVFIPPAGRAEFVVTAPDAGVKRAMLSTRSIKTGPAGDSDPARPLAIIQTTAKRLGLPRASVDGYVTQPPRFADLATAKVTARRKLFFSELLGFDKNAPRNEGKFFITVAGQYPEPYSSDNPPAIITRQGAVEDWIIENRTSEVHEFHIHQIHFLLLEVNGKAVPKEQQQFYDTYQVPWYRGKGPWPRIKVRMDFRGAIAGDFVYHCHILDHEDAGMMAKIRVLPPG